jgi:PTS system nitrogen regulatory IIA component
MNLADYLKAERVRLDAPATNRREVLEGLGALLGGKDETVREAVAESLRARELMGSTGVGGGIAFPHARAEFVPSLRLAFLRTAAPVPFEALDGRPVDLFLAVAGPAQGRREYLAVLGSLSYLFRADHVRDRFRAAASAADVVALFGELAAETPAGPAE